MKKLTAKEICGGVIAAGIAICLLVYMFVFTKYRDETDVLKASNADLQNQVNDLKIYYDNMPMYQQNIKAMRELVDEITADYPGDAREEDVIMKAVDMQSVAAFNLERINIGSNNVIHSIPESKVKELRDENLTKKIDFKSRKASYSCETDYANFKSIVQEVYDDQYRVGINSVSFSKSGDEDNLITGTIDISYYNLDGMNKEYKKPEMPEYLAGVADFFASKIDDEDEVVR